MQLPDIRPDHIELVRQILQKHVPRAQAWVFGSRAKWTARDTSDLDLCINAQAVLSFEQMGALREAFEDSNLPYKVDVVDWASTSGAFRAIIDQSKVPLLLTGDETVKAAGRAVYGRGGVMGEWRESTLGELCLLITDGAHQSPKSTIEGFPMASVKDLDFYGLNLNTARKICASDYQSLVSQGCKPKIGDVLIAKDGNSALDTVCVHREGAEVVLLSSVAILRPNSLLIDSNYLYLALRNPTYIAYLKDNFISGAAVPRVVLRDFKRARISVPNLTTQQAIAAVLSALDDKIELNRRMNETLEASARALFRDWFVDFGPVKAKAHAKAANAPATPNPATLAPEIWSLFPDALDDEGKPEGWEWGTIKDHLELKYGKSLPARERTHGPFPVYGSGGRTGTHNQFHVEGPTVIVGRKGTVGSLFWEDQNSYPIDTVFYVEPNQSLVFCYELLSNQPLKTMNTDAAVPGLNRENVYRLELANPPAGLIELFDTVTGGIRNRITANIQESRTLAETRDMLLPKLMSGEIRVRAETLLEAAV
jgi:type I restriction enzyme, S subunit